MSETRERTKIPPSRPFVPKLAATASKFRSNASLAPRLALSAQTTPVTTNPIQDGVRRPVSTQSNIISPRLRNTPNEPSTTTKLLSSPNVTPRSAARRARAGSIQSTPTELGLDTTPTSSHLQPTTAARGSNNGIVLPARPNSRNSRPGSASSKSTQAMDEDKFYRIGSKHISQSSPSLMRTTKTEGSTQTHRSSFFHASDAQPQTSTHRPPLAKKKSSTFIHADGRRESTDIHDSADTVLSETAWRYPTAIHDSQHLDFTTPQTTHNTQADQNAFNQNTHHVISSSPSKSTPTIFPPHSPPFFRSPSPTKDNFHLSYRKGISQIMRPHTSVSPPRSQSSSSRRQSNEIKGRRSSLDTLPEPEQCVIAPQQSIEEYDQSFLSQSLSPRIIPPDPVASPPLSPSLESSHNNANIVADARMERKVLDLEISNSSLLVINRSLEREIRKQKAELRRFRRMTRRSSVAAIRTSLISEGTGADLSFDMALINDEENDYSTNDDNDEEKEEDEEDETSENSSSAVSPRALAHHDAKHRHSDQRRLQMELSKHKEILIDSQKMNLSLKKCLDMTEQLIKDANKAMEWKVQLSDVKLGGRILFADDDDHHLVTGNTSHQIMEEAENLSPNFLHDVDEPIYKPTTTHRAFSSDDHLVPG